ncbi:MAG: TolC family protein [Opitutales bacterium]|jgi:outer membrane protein|nr:TolC family protein [Opitutales bacterium]MBT5168394.1 TolC family protein [Opitutales bacterium]MBT5816660.1 TolC family protein [Opitutales bacterium]MBT6380630.1 TolC family protein [Opitutales bacterium]MBT7865616.1 TolC family protein [Opitutales bacterium]
MNALNTLSHFINRGAIVSATLLLFTASSHGDLLNIEDCIRIALEKNYDVRISENATKRAEQDVEIANAQFQPSLAVSTSDSFNTQIRSGDRLDGAAQPQSNAQSNRLTVSKSIDTGGTVSLSTRLNRNYSNSTNSTINPRYNASTTLSIRQPLLSGYGPGVARANRKLSKLSLEQTQLDFQATVLTIINTTEAAYHSLVFAQEQHEVRKAALDLAEDLLEENKTKEETGIATSLDVLQAKVGVANATDRLLRADKAVEDAQDRLLTIIGEDSLLGTALSVEAPDVGNPPMPEIDSTFTKVIDNAPRYLTLLNQEQRRQVELRRSKRNRLASLNLNGDYALTGLEGSALAAYHDVTERESFNWQWSLSLDIPWGLNEKKANYMKAQIQLDTEEARTSREKQRLMRDTRIAIREVTTAIDGTSIKELATELSTQEFEMEKAKFDAGLSTGRRVLEAQQRMEESKVSELQSKIDLLNAYSDLRELDGESLKRYGIQFD